MRPTATAPGSCESAPQSYTATSSDNCVGLATTCTPPSGSTFPKGTTTVTCHATDGNRAWQLRIGSAELHGHGRRQLRWLDHDLHAAQRLDFPQRHHHGDLPCD